jgi:Big-like domain-containing protein
MRRGVVLAFVLGSLASLSPSSALAATGSYEVSACNYAPAAVNNSWTWATTDPSQPSHFAEHANCPYEHGSTGGSVDQEGGLSTTDALGLSSGAPPGTGAGWTFTAPTGTTITGITYERYIGHQSDPDNYWSPALRADGTIVPGETCLDSVQNGESCFVGGPPGEGGEPASITGLSAHQLSLGIVCQAPTGEECVTGATLHEVWAAMYGARVMLSDPTPPTLSPPSGALWGPGEAGGFHKGTESVTTSAQDVGGGVQSIVLAADGQPVETYDASCNFTLAQPCPTSTGAQTLTLPTTELSDGTHTLTLVATDAAGNQSTIASEQITVDNDPPPPPIGLAATATQAGGSTFTATWTDPSGQVVPITAATYQVCPASGSGSCSAPTAAPAAGPATVTVPGPGSWSLAVWLTNAAGNGTAANAAHTTLTVPAGSSGGGGSGGSGSGGSGGSGGSSTPKATIHVSETLHGRDLVVHVSGPATGEVRVSFTGLLGGRTVAWGAKTVALKHGRLTATFKLGPRTAAHATIHVISKLDHQLAVTSTLHRHASHHAGGTRKPKSKR